jgi:8-oxo-dGTP pyrophosphatase MutT (NUDIX family)
VYIRKEIIQEMENRYGFADEVSLSYGMTRREFDFVRSTQKHGRAHDVTLFIVEGNQVAVIKKPSYPPGAWRAPSGGIEPGEDFEVGALREAYEETGLEIVLDKYILRALVRFACESDVIDWTTHVFSARRLSGEIHPVDTREIVEARFASVEELRGSIKESLLARGSTGLRYRAELGDLVLNKLVEFGSLNE